MPKTISTLRNRDPRKRPRPGQVVLGLILLACGGASVGRVAADVTFEDGVLSNGELAVTWSDDGAWKCSDKGAAVLDAVRWAIAPIAAPRIDGLARPTDFRTESADGLQVEWDAGRAGWAEVHMRIALCDGQRFLTVRMAVKNVSDTSHDIECLCPAAGVLRLGTDPSRLRILTNEFQSWDDCRLVDCTPGFRIVNPWNAAVIDRDTRRGAVIGYLTHNRHTSSLAWERDAEELSPLRFEAWADYHKVTIAPGAELVSEPLMIHFGPDPFDALEQYADQVAAANKLPSQHDPACGWEDWYYYYGSNSEEDVLRNADAAARLKLPGLKYIKVTDCWQRHTAWAGDWQPTGNPLFPSGMAGLAREVVKRGFTPAIWLAPFEVSPEARIWKEHPDWMIRRADQTPIGSIDASHPDVRDWLRDLIGRVCEWGYGGYIMLDYLYAGVPGGGRTAQSNAGYEAHWHDETMTPAEVYRSGLAAMREAMGWDTYLLGCGAPLGLAAGYVNAMRIGADVAAGWGAVRRCAQAAARRYYFHGRTWWNDLDNLVVRPPLTTDQARSWATLIAITCGPILLGDDLTLLPEDRLDIYRRVMPPLIGCARPCDLFDSDIPAIWHMRGAGERRGDIVGLFNWSQRRCAIAVDLKDLGLAGDHTYVAWRDWAQRGELLTTGRLRIDLAPGACELVTIRPLPDHPIVIGMRDKLMGEARIDAERWDGERSVLTVSRRDGLPSGEFIVYVPDPSDGGRFVLVAAQPDAETGHLRLDPSTGTEHFEPPPRPDSPGYGTTGIQPIDRDLLVACIDCGGDNDYLFDAATQPCGRLSGEAYAWSKGWNVCPVASTCGFGEKQVLYRFTRLAQAKSYTLGVLWWDYDAGGRVQSILVGSAGAGEWTPLVEHKKLPSFTDKGEMPERIELTIPGDMIRDGAVDVMIRRDQGPNAVVSEISIAHAAAH
jgi:alpha-galactosidase